MTDTRALRMVVEYGCPCHESSAPCLVDDHEHGFLNRVILEQVQFEKE